MSSSHKIGFWAVFSIVAGSQIGTGVFMLPTSLANYGIFSLIGWCISGVGAIALGFVFASLCSRFPETGGPHVYIHKIFGKDAAFFVGWTYWIISWTSSTAVVVTAISSLHPLIGDQPPAVYLVLEIILLLSIMAVNLLGLSLASKVEFFLTILKFIPLLVISLVALQFFDYSNIVIHESIADLPTTSILGHVTLLTLWGFIGLETATTPAESVVNPAKNIPKAIIWGTFCVALLYFINSVAIMGLIPGGRLIASTAPYVDVAKIIFGGKWHLLLSCVISVICIGTLNAWLLAGSQVALGLAQDGLMPKIFAQKNKNNAPKYAILVSSVGIMPLLALTLNENFAKQINVIIDFSAITFAFIYLACCLGFLKLLITEKARFSIIDWVVGLVSTSFCIFLIYGTPLDSLITSCTMVLSIVPVYLFWYKKGKK